MLFSFTCYVARVILFYMSEQFIPHEHYMHQGVEPRKKDALLKKRTADVAGRPLDFRPDAVLKTTHTEMTLEQAAARAISIEDAELAAETKFEATKIGVQFMRGILEPVPHAVFASTAKFLHGTKDSDAQLLQRPPGDFDAVVFSEADLQLVRNRLTKADGVRLKDGGEFSRLPGGAKVLSGEVFFPVTTASGEHIISYPFEFFYNSVIVTSELTSHREAISGLSVLSRETLGRQYMKNLELESRVERAADAVAMFLLAPEPRADFARFVEGGPLPTWAQSLDLSADELTRFYEVRSELDAVAQKLKTATASDVPAMQLKSEELRGELTKILSGMKAKVRSRQASLEDLGLLKKTASDDAAELQSVDLSLPM